METENFIKAIEKVKQKDKLDISEGEDLSIALMNLVSLEEHSFFSYVKTEDEKFLSMLETVRELRKALLARLVKKDDSETWCMSKHLLASSMRLYEVGNRLLHEGNKEEAKKMYKDAAELYGLFWQLNKPNKTSKAVEKEDPKTQKSIFGSVKKLLECCKE